jgi:putative PIN family toxin of toxin-antitoxin system
MLKVVFDTTVLVSAFLRRLQGGVSFDLLQFVDKGLFELYVSGDILEEVADTLITHEHIRRRYQYPETAVVEFCKDVARLAVVVGDIPEVHVVRDPDDDMIVACAFAAGADYLVSRDKDLLSLGEHEGIAMITPEAFMYVLRKQ